MAVTLHLATEDNRLQAFHEATLLADTAVTDLPNRAACLEQPYEFGPQLFHALGGPALLALLDAS